MVSQSRLSVVTNLALLLGAVFISPAYAAGEDSNPNADYMQQMTTEESHSSTSWASRHTSFPKVPLEQAQDFTCFMTSEDGQTFNLEALCGESTVSNPQKTPEHSSDLNQN